MEKGIGRKSLVSERIEQIRSRMNTMSIRNPNIIKLEKENDEETLKIEKLLKKLLEIQNDEETLKIEKLLKKLLEIQKEEKTLNKKIEQKLQGNRRKSIVVQYEEMSKKKEILMKETEELNKLQKDGLIILEKEKKELLQIKENIKRLKEKKSLTKLKEEVLKIIEQIELKIKNDEKILKIQVKELSETHNKKLVKIKKDEAEYKRINEEKLKIAFRRQKLLRTQKIKKDEKKLQSILESQKTEKKVLKETLEDMCIIGTIIKEKIIDEKKTCPKKFIEIKEAIKEEKKDDGIFCLGLLAQNLENQGIKTVIEKEKSNDSESIDYSITTLQFIMSGLTNKKKYSLHFDFGEEKNEILLTNIEEQKKFNDKLRKKLSKDCNIPEDKIIVACHQRGSDNVKVIFDSDFFNDDNFNPKNFKEKFNNDKEKEFQELCYLKEVKQDPIMDACKLTPDMLDSRGDRESGWGVGEKRGGRDYIPPEGWKGYGLNVFGKYDNGNNDWLAYDGNKDEWCIAYHAVGKGGGLCVPDAINNIIQEGFKSGPEQFWNNDDDLNHPGEKIGVGVYCTPIPKEMDYYAEKKGITEIKDKKYKMAFMMRVKPDRIRICKSFPDYWVLDGTVNEMRPYRILIQEC